MVSCFLERFRKSCESLVKTIWQSKTGFTKKLMKFAKLMSLRVVSFKSFSYAQWKKKEKPLEITSLALSTSLHLIVLPFGIAAAHKELKKSTFTSSFKVLFTFFFTLFLLS